MSSFTDPKWLTIARSYLGEEEIPGPEDSAFIMGCFSHTLYPLNQVRDEVPWCAAFICRVLEEAGEVSTKSARALSYLNFGEESPLVPGALLVFQWPNGNHHVTLLDHVIDDHELACIGGNQQNRVKISIYLKRHLVACRFPK